MILSGFHLLKWSKIHVILWGWILDESDCKPAYDADYDNFSYKGLILWTHCDNILVHHRMGEQTQGESLLLRRERRHDMTYVRQLVSSEARDRQRERGGWWAPIGSVPASA